MHARELVELAAILSAQGPALVRGTTTLSGNGIQQYWTASKCRLDRWARSLSSFADDAAQPESIALRVQWPFVRGVLEEILSSEMLTRVWTAVLCLYDRRRGAREFESIARSILIGHLEARQRVLRLLVRSEGRRDAGATTGRRDARTTWGIDAKAAEKLNRLRRRAERWTDVLVGHLARLGDVAEFAIDGERAMDFAQDLNFPADQPGSRHAWPLLQASLRAAFARGMAPVSPNEDLNAQIASSVLSCFPGELFDSTGLFRSLWLHRLANVTSDVEGMIETLVGCEAGAEERPRRFER